MRRRAHRTYPYPTPDLAMGFINDELAPLVASLTPEQKHSFALLLRSFAPRQ